MRVLLGRTVTALGDLYDRVGVLDGKGARQGHESNPIDIVDSDSDGEIEIVEGRGSVEEGTEEREIGSSDPSPGPSRRPRPEDWFEEPVWVNGEVISGRIESEVGPVRTERKASKDRRSSRSGSHSSGKGKGKSPVKSRVR